MMYAIEDGNYTYHWEVTEAVFYFFKVIGATGSAVVFETCSSPPSAYDGLYIYIPKDLSNDLNYLEEIGPPRKKTNNVKFSGYVRNAFGDYDRCSGRGQK